MLLSFHKAARSPDEARHWSGRQPPSAGRRGDIVRGRMKVSRNHPSGTSGTHLVSQCPGGLNQLGGLRFGSQPPTLDGSLPLKPKFSIFRSARVDGTTKDGSDIWS